MRECNEEKEMNFFTAHFFACLVLRLLHCHFVTFFGTMRRELLVPAPKFILMKFMIISD